LPDPEVEEVLGTRTIEDIADDAQKSAKKAGPASVE
jgi:hypothetical protein